MSLKDLSGKTVYELEREDFEELFCQRCSEYDQCPRDDLRITGCKLLVDSGFFDKLYRKD